MAEPPKQITAKKVILCEGKDDEAFLNTLLAQRGLQGFEVRIAGDGGIGEFKGALVGIRPQPGFSDVETVVLIADCDIRPAQNFNLLRRFIRHANKVDPEHAWPVPTTVAVVAEGTPNVYIWMVPAAGVAGGLESLVWAHIADIEEAMAACVDTAAACTGASNWNPQTLSKGKVRAFLSLANQTNPNCGVGKIWEQGPGSLTVAHPTYDTLAAFLASI